MSKQKIRHFVITRQYIIINVTKLVVSMNTKSIVNYIFDTQNKCTFLFIYMFSNIYVPIYDLFHISDNLYGYVYSYMFVLKCKEKRTVNKVFIITFFGIYSSPIL